jgi:hypothetical protein
MTTGHARSISANLEFSLILADVPSASTDKDFSYEFATDRKQFNSVRRQTIAAQPPSADPRRSISAASNVSVHVNNTQTCPNGSHTEHERAP